MGRTLHGCVDWNNNSFFSWPIIIKSHPSRVRGLKYLFRPKHKNAWPVAPFTGAWIEITRLGKNPVPEACRTLHGCVDWNNLRSLLSRWLARRTLHGCVDWNFRNLTAIYIAVCRTLHGCVDWNIKISLHKIVDRPSHPSRVRGLKSEYEVTHGWFTTVAPFTGAWIEIRLSNTRPIDSKVAPFTGAWIEILPWFEAVQDFKVAPFTGAWIEIYI